MAASQGQPNGARLLQNAYTALEIPCSWSFVFENPYRRYYLFDHYPRTMQIDTHLMEQARSHFQESMVRSWRGRVLSRFARVEVGTAIIGAMAVTPTKSVEVVFQSYRPHHVLTMAFNRPDILPTTGLDPLKEDSLFMPATELFHVGVGSSIVVFRIVSDHVVTTVKLLLIAITGLVLGILVGVPTRRADFGIAVAAVWVQFAQVARVAGQGRRSE